MKETFIIRTEWMDAIFELELEAQAIIFQNLFYFHSDKNNLINLNNPQVKLVWRFLEPNLTRNIEYYDKRKETSRENGKKGGRPMIINQLDKNENNLNNLNKPKKPRTTLSDTDTDTDTVKKEIKELYKKHLFFNDKEFCDWWDEFLKVKKRKKASLSEKALSDQIVKVDKWSSGNVGIALQIVKKSVNGGWSDLYEPKENEFVKPSTTERPMVW